MHLWAVVLRLAEAGMPSMLCGMIVMDMLEEQGGDYICSSQLGST